MSAHFCCPHCHCPIDPARMEIGTGGAYEYRICPECDGALVVIPFALSEAPGQGMPPAQLSSPAWVTAVCQP